MIHVRSFACVASVAAIVMLMSSTSVFADHLDRYETRKIVRHLEERSDALRDRVDDWINEHPDERMHRAEELLGRLDHFEDAVTTLRSQLVAHDEAWDVRDQAKAVIDAAIEVHHTLDHAEYLPREIRHDWEGLRDRINELATHYHLDPVG